ncbi:MAG: hypothetical protein Q8O53_03025 [Candidatus Moranbacteria bacterium]|nr:hypothetical protein [Candidatus Moranbacteria bacterium]
MLPLYYQQNHRLFIRNLLWLLVGGLTLAVFLYFMVFRPPNPEGNIPQVDQEENTSTLSDWVDTQPPSVEKEQKEVSVKEKEYPVLPPPPPPVMEKMKTRGCVADGFLSGYGGDINSSIALINRSQCYYLHRALETWLQPPDFKLARKIMNKVTKPNTVYGMFIAEAIDTNANYYYPDEGRDFDFDAMCRTGSKNYWGEHTCKPSLEREEYRKYVKFITDEAMSMGIQSFLFGQVFYQDSSDHEATQMPEVLRGMQEHAEYLGLKIVVGAQTNDIDDGSYLRLFDYIEGGVGLGSDGSIESGECFSRWWNKPGDWCWALLWHSRFSEKANNVLVHFDWSGKLGDDMSVFTRMDRHERATTLKRLHAYFTSRQVGFLMPMLATLHRDNGGCSGLKKRFYSASRKYSCEDEDIINDIMSRAR